MKTNSAFYLISFFFFVTNSFGNVASEKSQLLQKIDSTKVKPPDSIISNAIWKDSNECEYNGWAINSIFNIPILRYNISTLKTNRDNLGSLEYFNALGAGFSISWGTIYMKTKDGTDLATSLSRNREVEMKNVFGLSLGFLFSKSEGLGENDARVIFTPNISLQILDFQFGYGYELGTVENSAHRSIFTVTYGIPITKFTNAGSFLLTKPKNVQGTKLNLRGTF